MMNKYTIRDITEIGIFTAIAIVLNLPFFKIKFTPTGGSISFVMIPLFIIAIRHSWWKTFISCGVIYALIACLTSGHEFFTFPFDYFLGYGCICIISLFNKLIMKENKMSYLFLAISVIVVTTLRFIFSTISSMIFFEYKIIPALIYNAPYIYITGAIGLAVMLYLLKPLKAINKKHNNRNTNNN